MLAPAKTKPAAVKLQTGLPDFIQEINQKYAAQEGHVFDLHGNIYDFCDNGTANLTLMKVLAYAYDDHIQNKTAAAGGDAGISNGKGAPKIRLFASYDLGDGLSFPHDKSFEVWKQAFEAARGSEWVQQNEKKLRPKDPSAAMNVLAEWFRVSKELQIKNRANEEQGITLFTEVVLTIAFDHADSLFPHGDLSNLSNDRQPIVYLRKWAKDQVIGGRNRILLITRNRDEIHESIRTELSSPIRIRKPGLEERREWVKTYDATIKVQAAAKGGKLTVGNNTNISGIVYADGFDLDQFAIQSAGMNRQQLKDVILSSWRSEVPLDFSLVQERKSRALEDEYGGAVNILQPTFGFEEVGGHQHFKDYAMERIVKPLKAGNRKLCSRGVLQTGPPGTGKSMIAWALAKEAGLNFLIVDLGKVFGGLVGETEAKMRRLIEAIEAASPCIVFIDEIDSVLSSGRQSAGDSGTAGRVFNNFMTWMSDPSRVGKVVVIAATNRPDLLDTALIREGRIDIKIPMLPPFKGDGVGRWSILASQTKKQKIVLADDLIKTKNDKSSGLGRLLWDTERYWTGAEIEGVLKESMYKAAADDSKKVQLAHWDRAMNAYVPSTGDMEFQIDQALKHINNYDFVPEAYVAMARDRGALEARLQAHKKKQMGLDLIEA